MQLCGCLPVGHGARDEDKQSNVKQPMKRYSLKRGMLIQVILSGYFMSSSCRNTDKWS